MITQIYTVQTAEEAREMVKAGVDHIGTTPTINLGLPGEIDYETCREIFAAIGDDAKKLMLTVSDTPEEIYEELKALQPDMIQVCGYNYKADAEFVKKAKEIIPHLEVIQAVGVSGPEAIEESIELGEFVDYIILDSIDEEIDGIGAAGVIHDWNISKEIVKKSKAKIILAGGLGVDNVVDAIREVKPYAVDSLTKTNKYLEDGSFVKDMDKVREFVRLSQEAKLD